MSVEIKVGQKYRVVDAKGFNYPIAEGDILTIVGKSWQAVSETTEEIIVCDTDIIKGYIEPVSDVAEDTEKEYDTNTRGSSENISDSSKGSSRGMSVGESTRVSTAKCNEKIYGNALWKIIEGACLLNGHKDIEIEEMSIEELKSIVDILEENYPENQDSLGIETISIRMYLEDDYVSASVYQEGYWSDGEHPLGHRDRLLFSVNKLTGV